MSRRILTLILFGLTVAGAAEWQWSVPVPGGRHQSGEARAYLWIPPTCRRVRAVVVAQHNLEEISICDHPGFRTALAELGVAQVWASPPYDLQFRFTDGAAACCDTMLDALAQESGYDELRTAPIIPIGHSAAASSPYYIAAWKPERTLAALSVSGQWPFFRDPRFAPDIWGGRTIDGVPCLETMGEYEAAESWAERGLKDRRDHPRLPLSMLACPAEGHFASSDEKTAFLALYIRKALQYRLGADDRLKPMDPTTAGWLVPRWSRNEAPTVQPAPVMTYAADKSQAFWCFDEEHARATLHYQERQRGKRTALLGIKQDGKWVEQSNSHEQLRPRFDPADDSLHVRLEAAFYDTVPAGSPRPANWSGQPAGSPVGHPAGGGAPRIDIICGPCVRSGPDTFAMRPCRGLGGRQTTWSVWFAAAHPGDAQYRASVQQACMEFPARNTTGTPQRITMQPIPDQQPGAEVKLTAVSDAGLPVFFHVESGPAEIDGDTLRLTAIPPRARQPVAVTVVASQWGRAREPRVQTAEPVTLTFRIRS